MAATKVLVVDDSLTMRALISGALERIPDVQVVGLAEGADEARAMTEQFKPHVITLDIEMPGMSGLEYLAEVMEKRPMPVIMFSTRTEAGAEASVEALRLGAIDCFPKPKVATPAELDKIIVKLAKRIKAAKNADVRAAAPPAAPAAAALEWNGRPIAIGADASYTKALFQLFATFPANCPPTIVVQHLGPGLIETVVEKLRGLIAPKVVIAGDGTPVEQGTIYFAPPGDAHLVLDKWPEGRLRLLPRDPVAGERPSVSVLFASMSKAVATDAVALLMSPMGEDGMAGVNALQAAGGFVILPAEEGQSGFTVNRRHATQPLAAADLPRALLKLCSK